MRAWVLLGGAALALSSTLALAAPESLLPPVFNDNPAPTPGPAPAPTPAPTSRVTLPEGIPTSSREVVQPLPQGSSQGQGEAAQTADSASGGMDLPDNFPTLAELEAMDADQIDEVLGLRPKFDVPPAARRAMRQVGVIGRSEGGFASASLAKQPAALVRATLQGTKGPMVSRWGHILLRRALATRLDAPEGMDPVEFTTLRARVLNNLNEGQLARALVQDVDSSNYDLALMDEAFNAYMRTGDVLGMCPAARLDPTIRDDGEWEMLQAICSAYLGEERSAGRRLDRALGTGAAPEIDVRLAQRFAGAAGEGRRAVNIEWDGVDELNPWRFALARALGVDVPASLLDSAAPRYRVSDVLIPAVPLARRAQAADEAGGLGVISSAAMVDLYSQIYVSDAMTAEARRPAIALRNAYVARDPSARMEAARSLWGEQRSYARMVLTAYAAARMPVQESLSADAGDLIASMLTAGLDRNAMRWSRLVDDGTLGWALLSLARPDGQAADSGALSTFIDDDASEGQRKAKFLVAGLAGLGRIDADTAADAAADLDMTLQRQSAWTQRIRRAGEVRNAALVAMLAGLGMQGEDWSQMTPRQLFAIVQALNAAGLDAEARMIAAEAVARA